MSAQFDADRMAAEARFEPLLADRLDEVLRVEQRAYALPWSRANFIDALHSGYQAQMLLAGFELLGYFVAMKGVDEVHLLNITVAPEYQGQGWSRILLEALTIWARGQGAQWLWLEVRVGNHRALRVYEAHGYRRVGLRKDYYPALHGKREDAIVMSLRL
ncbi:MAG: ribosomal protein S18-alanine N-acetyltransferase [Rhodoferax sp.]|nr:ribosomal protein S18-alanine N-acetyltransferase [Rhodoferax sp.]